MSENRIAQDVRLTFSDEDFERRYSADQETSPPPPARPASPIAAQIGRSRNRFMRTLVRRRLASSAASLKPE